MDFTAFVIIASSLAAALAVVLVFAAGWIAACRIGPVARAEPVGRQTPIDGDIGAASRITMADMRERLRRLEAIAAGIDL